MVLTRTLYGEEAAKRPDLLPEQDKERIRTLSSAVAAVVGGVSGSRDGGGNAVDVLANAQVGGVVGRNAVENNYLAFSPDSNRRARRRLRAKIRQELGGKFEIMETGKYTNLGYEIMELKPIQNYTIQDLTPDELRFYNMLNGVIEDPTGTAHIRLVYDDPKTAGGSWITGNFDVSDMEKFDRNGIIYSGNTLIAHEFYEQLDKDKLGLQPGIGSNDRNYATAHGNAIMLHEPKILPFNIRFVEGRSEVNGVEYSSVYRNTLTRRLIGIKYGIYNSKDSTYTINPSETIIDPNKDGIYILVNPDNRNSYYKLDINGNRI